MVKVKDIARVLEEWAPPIWQESYDNSGLIVGNPESEVRSVLISLDCTPAVVEEAIAQGCNLIVSHHPIVFKGLKTFTGKNYVEQTVIKAIKNDIALYAIHTNLDSVHNGVSAKIAEKLGVLNPRILTPKRQALKKLITYVPVSHATTLREAVAKSGAGALGAYADCSFSSTGLGRFTPLEGSEPYVGTQHKLHVQEEERIEVVYPIDKERGVIQAMRAAHPYEEVAFQIVAIENMHNEVGLGVIGELPEPMETKDFLLHLKHTMGAGVVRYTHVHQPQVKRIAICGGSGSFLLGAAKAAQADVFVTADFKYHEFFDAEKAVIIADIGHYESEQYTSELICEYLSKKFATFAFRISAINTNPVNYL